MEKSNTMLVNSKQAKAKQKGHVIAQYATKNLPILLITHNIKNKRN